MIEYKVKVYEDRTEWYNLQGQLHRENGPAIEYFHGTKCWYLNGKFHRIDGPAVEWSDGHKEYYLNGNKYSEKEYWKRVKSSQSCSNKIVEIDGKKYKLQEI